MCVCTQGGLFQVVCPSRLRARSEGPWRPLTLRVVQRRPPGLPAGQRQAAGKSQECSTSATLQPLSRRVGQGRASLSHPVSLKLTEAGAASVCPTGASGCPSGTGGRGPVLPRAGLGSPGPVTCRADACLHPCWVLSNASDLPPPWGAAAGVWPHSDNATVTAECFSRRPQHQGLVTGAL